MNKIQYSLMLLVVLLLLQLDKTNSQNNKYLVNNNIKFLNRYYYFKTLIKQPVNTILGKINYKYLQAFTNSLNIDEIDFKFNFLYSIDLNKTQAQVDTSYADNDVANLFGVNKFTNEIYTNKMLNVARKYAYNLLMINKTTNYVINNVKIIIKVVSDYNIKFIVNPYEIQVSDATPQNTVLLKLNVIYDDRTDDDDNNNDEMLSNGQFNDDINKIIYKIDNHYEESIQKYFDLNANNGELRAKSQIKRDINTDVYKLTVSAIDINSPQLSATTVVNIRVIDTSSSSSLVDLLKQNEYNVTINENEDYFQKPVVFKLNQTSNNAAFNYALIGDKIELSTFEIDNKNGDVYLIDRLDYELKSHYKLIIIVSDITQYPQAFAYVNLNINILDMNNNAPKFTENFYEFTIINSNNALYKTPVSYIVGKIDAYDRDSVLKNNSKIVYEISNDRNYSQFPFQIDYLNGSIYLTSDIELNDIYEFSVIARDRYGASDSLSSNVKCLIKVINLNENYLFRFENSTYKLALSEDTIVSTVIISLNVINIINEKTTLLNFLINSGNYDNLFEIKKLTNSRAQLLLKNTLDYRNQIQHRLVVKAIDQSGLYTTCTIEINVLPINLQQPRFTKDLYEFSVYENATLGSLVGSVNAIDGDFGENGHIKYSLISNTDSKEIENVAAEFKLDENNGNLYVENKLDRETNDKITLYVSATDNGLPPRMDRALVQIKVLDVNDNQPIFTKSSYKTSIYEDSTVGTYLLRVEATDKDSDKNGIVRYSLKSCCSDSITNQSLPFSIDPISGIIRVSSKLDRETQDWYNISVIATDLGEPPLSSIVPLQIEILDVNDNAPVFGTNLLTFYLLENQPIGTEIANITATDADIGVNADIVYKMLDGYEYFQLKSSGRYNTVILTSKFIADYESNQTQFEFNLRAYSGLLYTDCVIKVLIKDVNDNAPILANPFKIVFNNYKNNFFTDSFARIPAHDLDASDNLTYTLLDSIGKQFITLNSLTGEITLKPILNSNNQIKASFMVSVTDGLHEVQATCQLTVLMVTDNMLAESVTISLTNANLDQLLEFKYDTLTESINEISFFNATQVNVHIFDLESTSAGVNVSLAVSIDYAKDLFLTSSILKQVLYAHLSTIETNLSLGKLSIYDDPTCAIEPCPNYQQCNSNVRFSSANSYYQSSSNIQFRSIHVRHDFSCACATGFTGKVSSINCDLEINLCYSNPCGQNGVCISLESSYYCICDADFTGRNCEYNLKLIKCCDSASMQIKEFNNTNEFLTECSTVSSANRNYKFNLNNDRICQGASECRNLAQNGGIACDKCNLNGNLDSKSYTQYCELRSKHFPKDKNSYLIVPGIKNRMRFKIKFTFATVKQTSYLFYNGRVDSKGEDFISLEIENGRLVLKYSLGDVEVNELRLNAISVSDGKWHTVTIIYSNHNFTLSVDNDENELIDSCELARNQNKTDSELNELNECYRVHATYVLPIKCKNQIEACFRYFDLNGPLIIGRGSFENKKRGENRGFYHGCISDLSIDERFIDLNDNNILNFGTENGCKPKDNENVCKLNTQYDSCETCLTVWGDLVKCNCNSNDYIESSYCKLKLSQNLFSFNSNGYLMFKENLKSDATESLKIEFYVRINRNKLSSVNNMILAYLELYSNEQVYIYLKYSIENKYFTLKYADQDDVLNMSYSSLTDGYWHKISINLNSNNSIGLVINDLFEQYVKYSKKNLLAEMQTAKWYIGGSPLTNEIGLNGCIKEIQRDFTYLSYELINATNGCELNSNNNNSSKLESNCGLSSNDSPCYNNGICDANKEGFTCNCSSNFKGKYCQYGTSISLRLVSEKLSNSNGNSYGGSNCPAKWWGIEQGICGPCQCDESLNFSPDCHKHTGVCECKAKYYKKFNKITKKEYCAPCDCYLEGSSSLQCHPITGQCNCLKESGITGRRCDSCLSPFAEIIDKGSECRVLSNNECPKAYFNNIWWPRTLFNTKANSSCPKGSTGTAYRKCVDGGSGWSKYGDLSECSSNKLIDLQIVKWHDELVHNKSELNSYQALKLVEDLKKIIEEADIEDYSEVKFDNDDDTDLNDATHDDNGDTPLNTYPTSNYLYINDLLIIKNLTIFIINYEILNAPSFLYIQDKYFLNNFFTIINNLFSKKYENLWKYSTHQHKYPLNDLFFSLDRYLNNLLKQNSKLQPNQQQHLLINEIILNFDNLNANINSKLKLEDKITRKIKFKLINTNRNSNQTLNDANSQMSYLILKNNLATSLPNRLILNNEMNRQLINYKIASDILMFNIYNENNQQDQFNNSTNILIEFAINNNDFDNDNSAQVKRNHKFSSTLMKSVYCVYLNEEMNVWSTYGAKILSIDIDKNLIKCSFSHLSIYTTMMPVNIETVYNTRAVPFSVITYVFIAIAILILIIVLVLLISLGTKQCTSLTCIYTNFCLNLFLLQFIYIIGINNITNSIVACKLTSLVLHYLHLSTFLWLLIISLHLYRMLTELRDINKTGSRVVAFYYVIAYVIPTIITSLTLGIKQDLYTSQFITNTVLTYCWLNSIHLNDIIYSLFIPNILISLFILVLIILSYKEALRKTFKQTDVGLVRYSMLSVIILLFQHCLLTIFLFLNVYTLNSNYDFFIIYENLYLIISIVYSISILLLFIVFDKYTKVKIYKNIIERLFAKSTYLDESLCASKANLCNKSPFINCNANRIHHDAKDLVDINVKYMLDIQNQNNQNMVLVHGNQCNSISTTTTSGTLEHLENLDDLVNGMNQMSNYRIDYNSMGVCCTTSGTSTISSSDGSGRDCGIDCIGPASSSVVSGGYNLTSPNGFYTTTFTDTTTNDSEINYRLDLNPPTLSAPSISTATSSTITASAGLIANKMQQIRECDIIDVSKILKTRESMYKQSPKAIKQIPALTVTDQSVNVNKNVYTVNNHASFVDSSETGTITRGTIASSLPTSPFEKTLNVQDRRQSNNDWLTNNLTPIANSDVSTHVPISSTTNHTTNKQTSKMSLFWPNTLAECDISTLDGSSYLPFSPSKLIPNLHSNGAIPDILSCSTAKKMSSTSSNSNTSTSSNSNTNLLNSSLNYVNVNAKPMISLIPLNANKLENDSSNETRV